MFYGLLDLSFWGYVAYALIATHITIAAVTIYLHRGMAHNALELHPIISHFFRFWLWLTTGMVTKAWMAIHRKHHAKCETEEDPHSPVVLGLAQVLLEGAELYRKEAKNQETLDRYGVGAPDDWVERNIYSKSSRGFLILLVLEAILLGIPGITIWAIQMAWIPFFAAGIINGVGHNIGYRNFDCNDASTNIVPWGILIGGEELHNNHHTYSSSAKLSVKWWEFDIGWMYIKIFSMLGLAKVKRLHPKAKPTTSKDIDSTTLEALLLNRFHVMAEYTKGVIRPVFKQISKGVDNKQRADLKLIKSGLFNENNSDDFYKLNLQSLIDKNNLLEVVYNLKYQLQEIWDRTKASQEELIKALQDWCRRAEDTGIKYLQDFANYIRGYSIAFANK